MMYVLLPLIALACGLAAISKRGAHRARDSRGRFVADDKRTWWRDEAWRNKK